MESQNPTTHKAPVGRGSGLNHENTAPQFCYPSSDSVKGRVLADLLRGHQLTPLNAWVELGTSRLAAHIHILRGLGWPIDAEDVVVITADGRKANVARYTIPLDVIVETGDRGLAFIDAVRRHYRGGAQ